MKASFWEFYYIPLVYMMLYLLSCSLEFMFWHIKFKLELKVK